MVGDRYLTDIVYGNRNGLLTIRPAPLTMKGDPSVVRMVRYLVCCSRALSHFLLTLTLAIISGFMACLMQVLHLKASADAGREGIESMFELQARGIEEKFVALRKKRGTKASLLKMLHLDFQGIELG